MAILTGDAEEAALVDSQWLFTSSDLEQTPTVVLGLMNVDEERRKRANGVGLIYSVGERMRLMSHVVTTAAAFFHRFFMRRPMRPVGYIDPIGKPVTFDYQDVALAALYLAGKTEESYRKLTDLVGVGLEHENRIAESLEQPSEATLRSAILRNEERLLETLCFDLIVPHPQKYLLLAANRLGISVDNKPLVRIAYAHIHDAFRDPVCLFYEAPVLAAGALALACDDLGVGLGAISAESEGAESSSGSSGGGKQTRPPLTLLEAFDVDQEEVDAVVADLKAVRAILDKDPKINRGARPTPTASGSATPYHRSWNAPPPPPSRGELGVGGGGGPSRSMAGTPLRGGVSGSVNTSPLVPPPMERVAAAAGGVERPDLTRPPSRHGSARAEGAVPFGSPPVAPSSAVRPPPAPAPAAAPYRLLSPVLTQPEPSAEEGVAAPPPAPEATRASSSSGAAPPIVVQPAAKSSYVPLSPPNYSASMDVDAAPPPPAAAAAAAVEQEAARKVAEEQRRTEQSQGQGQEAKANAGAGAVVSAANSVVRSEAEEGEIDE